MVVPSMTVVGYPLPSSPVGLYSNPEKSTPFNWTVQPPLAVTILFPEILRTGGEARAGVSEQRAHPKAKRRKEVINPDVPKNVLTNPLAKIGFM
jgi:hypothetical protein